MIADEIWSLPGPRRFLIGVVEHSFAGSSAVVFAPHYLAPTLVVQIRAELRTRERRVDTLDGDIDPVVALASSVEANDGFFSIFDQVARYGSRTLVIHVDSTPHLEAWWGVARRFQHHALKLEALSRPTLVIVSSAASSSCTEEVALKICDWKLAWGEIDSLALGDNFLFKHGRKTPIERIVTHTIARLALWDAELAKILSDRRVEVIKNPVGLLVRHGETSGWHASMAEDESNGSVGYENGHRMVHSSLLAMRMAQTEVSIGGEGELWRRRWQGQAVVLLPWIEEQRQLLVLRVKRFIRLASEAAETLEIGPLSYELARTNAPTAEKKKASALREARNRLAHGLILTHAEMLDVVGQCET